MKSFILKNYSWSLEELRRCIRENHLKSEIIYCRQNAAIVHVKSYHDSQILGAMSTWCICEHDCSWRQYVIDTNGIQLFIYRFDEMPEGDTGLYGATFVIENDKPKTHCCFTRANNPISKVRHFDTDGEALFRTVIIPVFGNIGDDLGLMFRNIVKRRGDSKPIEKKDEEIREEFRNDSSFNEAIRNFWNRPARTWLSDMYDDDDYPF